MVLFMKHFLFLSAAIFCVNALLLLPWDHEKADNLCLKGARNVSLLFEYLHLKTYLWIAAAV